MKDSDSKMKQALTKSKADQESLNEMKLKFERVQQQLLSTKEELGQTKQTLNAKETAHVKEKTETDQLREQEHFQQRLELADLNEKLRFELDSLKQKHRDTLEENITLKDRVKCLDSELSNTMKELEAVKTQLKNFEEDVVEAKEECKIAKDRAAELVAHNEKLTSYRSQIQAETSGLKENLDDLKRQFSIVCEENQALKTEASSLMADLAEERRVKESMSSNLQHELETSKTAIDDLQKRLSEQESLLVSSRKKFQREVKELQKQLRGSQVSNSHSEHLDVQNGSKTVCSNFPIEICFNFEFIPALKGGLAY